MVKIHYTAAALLPLSVDFDGNDSTMGG